VRVAWWVAIAGVMVGIGLSNAYPANRVAIYAVGGAAAGVVVILHELLPRGWRGRVSVAIEVLAALALASALVWLTGGGDSPFVFGYHVVAVAAALTMGSRLALLVAAAASVAYLGQVALVASGGFTSDELLRIGINLGSLWLLTYLAGVYASVERRTRARVLELSQTDALTGLLNRGQLFPTLDQEVQRTRRSGRGFCVLMIDLDGLKAINDSMGHLRGDDVLRSVGRVITGSVRAVDSAYRYGGDEFLVLLPETEFIGAFVVAEKIREGVEEIAESLGSDEATSVSIGLVSCPEDGSSSEELMTAADRAMYQAKSLGKNQISGNPRPRRVPPRRPVVVPPAMAERVAEPEPPAPEPVMAARPEPLPVAVTNGAPHGEGHGEDEPDPADMRRQIAAARLNMDPDHQIRRAMDALLSTPTARGGGE
jgi:diguanylate cyclase (GGDEF)-like protein